MRILIACHDRAGIGIAAETFSEFQKAGCEPDFVLYKKNEERIRDFDAIPEDRIFAVEAFHPAAAEKFLMERGYGLVIGSLEAAPTDMPKWGTVSKNALAAAEKLAIPSVGYLEALYRPDGIILDCFKNIVAGKTECIRPDVVAVQSLTSLFQVRRLLPGLHAVLTGNPSMDGMAYGLDKYRINPPLAAALAQKISDAYGLDLSRPVVCYGTSALVSQFRKADAQARLDNMPDEACRTAVKLYGYTDADAINLIDRAIDCMSAEERQTVQRVLRPHPKEDADEVKKWAGDRYALLKDGCEVSAGDYINFAALAALNLIPGHKKVNLTSVFANSGMAVDLYVISHGRAKILSDPPLPAAKASEFLKREGLLPDVYTSRGIAALFRAEDSLKQNTRSPILTDQKNTRRFVRLAIKQTERREANGTE